MDRRRLLISLQLIAALILAGVGHYYVSTLRELYPIDGYLFYLAAIVLFARVWLTVGREPDPVWRALRDSAAASWNVLRDSLRLLSAALRDLLPLMSVRTRTASVIGLNVLAALLALLLPSAQGLWLVLWLASLGLFVVSVWPRSTAVIVKSKTETPPAAPVWIEPAEAIRRQPRLAGLAIGLGALIIGQLLLSSISLQSVTPLTADTLASSLNQSLKLNLIGDPDTVLGGALLLVLGTLVLAWITRHSMIADRPRLRMAALQASGQRLSLSWLIIAIVALVVWFGVLRSIAEGASGWGGVLPWLIALSAIGLCWWKIDRVRGVQLALHLERVEAIGLGVAALVILIVFLLRLSDIPGSLWPDEAAFFAMARDIATGRLTPDVFGLGTYAYPMAGSVYQSVWIGLFGASVWAWRLGSIVAALLAIFPIYFLVRATLGRRVAWLSIGFYAVSPYLLTYARMGYNNVQSIAVVALTLALTWLAIRRDSRLYAFLAGCAGGLGFFTYTAARLGFVLALGWLLWTWLTRRMQGRTFGIQSATLSLGVLLVAAPTIVYGLARSPLDFADKQTEALFNNAFYARDLYSDEQLFSDFGPIRVGRQELFYAPDIYATLLVRGTLRTALSFHTSTLVTENYLVGALAEPLGWLYLIGLGWCLLRLRRPGYAIWAAWFLIGTFTLSAIDTFPARPAHLLPIAPALTTLGALGLVAGIDLLSDRLGGLTDRTKRLILIGLFAGLAFFGLRTYFVEMPQRFPPDLENAIFWQAQQLPGGSDITLIQPDGLADDFVPWGLREIDQAVNFHLIKPADFETIDPQSLCPNVCRFFYVAAMRDQIEPRLEQAFGKGSLLEYPDANGTVQAYAFVPQN